MTAEDDFSRSYIPSHFTPVLRSILGRRIVSATRYSWWAPEETEDECGVSGQNVFSFTAGPVAIAFDTGLVLGIASDPSTNSVSVWMEQNEAGQSVRGEPLASDKELHAISATDPRFADDFWRSIVGARVNAIFVLERKPKTARLAELPNEVGLCLVLDSGVKVVAAHGLHDDSDDFAIISDQMILGSLRAELQARSIGE